MLLGPSQVSGPSNPFHTTTSGGEAVFETADVFTMPAIARWQNYRTAMIHALLQSDCGRQDTFADQPLEYAIAHHILEGAEVAARSGDDKTFAWYRASARNITANLATATAAGSHIVLEANIRNLQQSPISETPYTLLAPDSAPSSTERPTLAEDAFASGERAGLGPLLRGHAAIVFLLRAKSLGATLDGWTISRLPGTIFADHVGDPFILGRDLIHEAGHNWLNDALSALEIKIDSEIMFFSPWKETHRPAFGFIHACWAFPLTMIYTKTVLPHVTGAVRDYLSAWLRQQCAMLSSTALDHENALGLLPDADLRERLRLVYRVASVIHP